ncbi:MAG: GTP-binding protein, partial [Candidatus Lokiarchaeota archaeon]|nr:GTP-binding protein [Candidatus Lokiarchaeota archaeon]
MVSRRHAQCGHLLDGGVMPGDQDDVPYPVIAMPLVLNSVKLLVGGEGGVGKTSILYRYIKNDFTANMQMTIGVQLHTRTVVRDDGTRASLVFWDLSGQERFKFMLPNYCGGASGAFILFDMYEVDTLGKIEDWFKLFKSHLPKGSPIILVGTKKDLLSPEQVEQVNAAALHWCQYFGCDNYLATSSKTGENV